MKERSERLGARLSPVDTGKNEGLGARLAQALSMKVMGWAGLACPIEVTYEGPPLHAWSGKAQPLTNTAHRGATLNIPDHCTNSKHAIFRIEYAQPKPL